MGMNDGRSQSAKAKKLRRSAEEELPQDLREAPLPGTPADTLRLLDEARAVRSALERENDELRRTLARRQPSEQVLSATLDSLTVLLCVLDETGEILHVNQPWREFAAAQQAPPDAACEGANYLDVCDRAVGPGAADAAVFAAGIRAVLNGEQQALSLAYSCSAPGGERWFHGRVKRLPTAGPARVVVTHQNITEPHFAYESLRVSEEKFRGLTTLAPVGIFLTDAVGYCVYANPRWCEMAGISPEAALGADWFHGVHPQDRLTVASGWQKTVASGGRWGQEFRLQAAAGDVTWVYSAATAIRDSAGQITGYVGINLDISKRKRAEHALRLNQERYRNLFDHCPVAIWEGDLSALKAEFDRLRASGVTQLQTYLEDHPEAVDHCASLVKILDVNEEWLRFFGGSGHGDVPQRLASCFTPASWPVFREELLALAAGQARWEGVMPIRDLYGNERIVVWRLAVQPSHRESLLRVLNSFTDITDRRRAEDALREASQFSEQVIRSVQEGIIVYDRDLRYQLWNPFMEQLTGHTAQETLGQRPEEVFPFLREVGMPERLGLALAGETPRQFDFPYVEAPGGRSGWVSDCSGPLRNAAGEITGVIATVRDITAQKQAEERLETLHLQLAHLGRLSTLGELLAGIAHEVNQPLYSIVNYAKACRNVLAQDQPSLTELKEWNQEIAAAAVRAGAIIQRLRSFLRRSDVQRLPVPIDEVVQESLDLVALETRRLQIAVQYVPDAANCQVLVDRVQIQQVLVNLLRNACEAMEASLPGSRELTVATLRNGDFAEVLVVDNGVGLPSVGPVKMFEPFVTTKPDGLGMGLAISKTIVEDHGGDIRAAANPHGGATFRFTLPTAVEDAPQRVSQAQGPGHPSPERDH